MGLALVLFVFLASGCERSPTGRKQLTLIPDEQVAALGVASFAKLKRTQPVHTQPRVNAYVECVTRALIEAVPEPNRSWEVVVFDEPTPNAFALPGGKIGIHSGMLEVADTPARLAAVIGHEIGHVLADHANERLTQQLGVQGVMLVLDLLTEDRGGWEYTAMRGALGLGARYGVLLPYSRLHEREADTIGLDLMARAGFDPRESLTLWRNMAERGGDQPPEFLSTHPAHASRLEELATQMDEGLAAYQAARARGRAPRCR
jgi:predicted Zn-dependent protease